MDCAAAASPSSAKAGLSEHTGRLNLSSATPGDTDPRLHSGKPFLYLLWRGRGLSPGHQEGQLPPSSAVQPPSSPAKWSSSCRIMAWCVAGARQVLSK